MAEMWELGCTGEFECNCPKRKAEAEGTYKHGTRSHYQRGCRCADCTNANAEYGYNYRNGYHRAAS